MFFNFLRFEENKYLEVRLSL